MKKIKIIVFLASALLCANVFGQDTDTISPLLSRAEAGDALAQLELGKCYYEGNGVEKDVTLALYWLRLAAEQGNGEAQCDVGIFYEFGEGVEMDYGEAVKWYRLAAEQGDEVGACNLGMCYLNGNGVEKDAQEGVLWLQQAANQGLAFAQYNLGQCYMTGNGVEENPDEAVKWFLAAAEQDYADALQALALCYREGYGVVRDYDAAKKWHCALAFHYPQEAIMIMSLLNTAYGKEQAVPAKIIPTDSNNNHEYVDLGLSVKWATCNIGASTPSDYGEYFSWGETTMKDGYTPENSITYGKEMHNIAGNIEYDAARANWGGTWRLPTTKEFFELIVECVWEWVVYGDRMGYFVIGPNGNGIFLPAAGRLCGGDSVLAFTESSGGYWSAIPCENIGDAYGLYFVSDNGGVNSTERICGRSVRAVTE